MLTDTVLQNLANNLRRLERLQGELTSGVRLSRPSDDPPAVRRALTFRAGISAGEQYLRNLDSSNAWLAATEVNLGAITDLLHRARELAVQGATDSLSNDERSAIAAEVHQILEQLVLVGNASLRGQRLFGGLITDADPFTLNQGPPTTVTYSGESGAMLREIDVGTTIQINVPGSSFLPAVFAALITLRDDLAAGNTLAISSNDIGTLDAALDDVLVVRSEVGARMNRVEATIDRQHQVQVRLQELLSKVQDTDFAAAITEFSAQETVYRAALESGSRALQPSLLDYLR
jgi:flagellar hook-associated protein 3 FlgL